MQLSYFSEKIDTSGKFKLDVDFLEGLLVSRESDARESILFRQGKGAFCLPSAGHENMAVVALSLNAEDHVFCHYRDRALMLALGVPLTKIALDFFAKKGSSSEGRQLASHFSDVDRNIFSCASPVASQCLPAVGNAWATKLSYGSAITVCCVGEASIRQGEFYEAWCFAVQEELPIVFIVEDNGYGISTATDNINPFKLGIFSDKLVSKVNGRYALEVHVAIEQAASKARAGNGPSILWITFDRLMSHTSSDDQKIYRSAEELDACQKQDPIIIVRNALYQEGILTVEQWQTLQLKAKEYVRIVYEKAERAEEPSSVALFKDVKDGASKNRHNIDFLKAYGSKMTMAKAINRTLEHLLIANKKIVLFGQDIEDAKGGVFGLTKGLSSHFPQRVFNSPLAEATICGTAVGMANAGFIPIFEIQFIDFIATGFNQIANQIATLRWRTGGKAKCPLVLLAPCGAYVHGGGPWHTQTNESLFAHIPGLQVFMPSNSADAADIIVNCAYGDNPSLVLLPKQLFYKEFDLGTVTSIHPNSASVIREGTDITVVAWGNCTELAIKAAEKLLPENISVEVIDIKSIVPCDMQTIMLSLAKTGRLVVVHEDNKTCSFGQSIISQVVTTQECWNTLYSSPRHVCREDVLIPFNTDLAKLVVPSVETIIMGIKSSTGL